jgi:CHAT domain-containing protein
MRLSPGTRVVLSACHAGAPGPRGLAFAFARAGAVAIAAARGEVDDAAAARWSEKFYAALGRGLSFVRANREAQSEAPFLVVK